jgi:hypothetical protein
MVDREQDPHRKARDGVIRPPGGDRWSSPNSMQSVHFFAVKGDYFALIYPRFCTAMPKSGGRCPGDEVGGETPNAVRRLNQARPRRRKAAG